MVTSEASFTCDIIDQMYIWIRNGDEFDSFVRSVFRLRDDDVIALKDIYLAHPILSEIGKLVPITVYVEERYVEKVFRDTYYEYYSNKYAYYPRTSMRLFIFKADILNEEGELLVDRSKSKDDSLVSAESTKGTADLAEKPDEKVNAEKTKSIIDVDQNALQNAFVGTVVISPEPTGYHQHYFSKGLLNSNYFRRSAFIKKSKFKVSMLGRTFEVDAFPFMMQDKQSITCAHASLLNLLEHYNNRYNSYNCFLPSEIRSEILEVSYQRDLPSNGLDFITMSMILKHAKFSPVLYQTKKLYDKRKLKRILHCYVESGIPIAIGVSLARYKEQDNVLHALCVIGRNKEISNHDLTNSMVQKLTPAGLNKKSKDHAELYYIDSSELYDTYIVMDDSRVPYCKAKFVSQYDGESECCPYRIKLPSLVYPDDQDQTGDNSNSGQTGIFRELQLEYHEYDIEYLLAPLYKRMQLDAMNVESIVTALLLDENLGIEHERLERPNLYPKNFGGKTNPFILRILMTSSKNYKEHLFSQKLLVSLMPEFLTDSWPRFIYVCELYDIDHYGKLCWGCILIDATSTSNSIDQSVLLVYYNGSYYYNYGHSRFLKDDDVEDRILYIKNNSVLPGNKTAYYIKSFQGNYDS